MPVENMPGLMDYLLPAINNYAQIDQQNKARDLQAKQMQMQQNQGNAGLMAQLFGAGAVDASQLQGALGPAGMGNVQVQPNKLQQRRDLLKQGQPAIDALSDEQKTDLGFETGDEKLAKQAKASGAKMEIRKNDDLNTYLNGGQLKPEQEAAWGLQGKSDIQLKKLAQLDPYLAEMGDKFIAGPLLQNGGRIPKGQAAQFAQTAFNNFIQNRPPAMGDMPPEQVAAAKAYFERATQNALIAQNRTDLSQYEAESQRIGANATATWRQNQGHTDQTVKWAGVLNRGEETTRKAIADLMKDPQMTIVGFLKPEQLQAMTAANPQLAQKLQQLDGLRQKNEAYRDGIAQLTNGAIPGTLPMLLKDAEQMGGKGAPVNTQAPRLPSQGGQQPPTQVDPADPRIQKTVQAILGGQATIGQLDQLVTYGQMPAEVAQRIKQLVQQGSQQKALNVPRADSNAPPMMKR